MNFPVYIEIGSLKLLLHTILEPVGMFMGFRYFLFLRKKEGDKITTERRLWIIIGAIFGAVMGSRLLGGFENPAALLSAKNPLLYIYQNKTVLGGFLGGLLGVELTKFFLGEKRSSGDLFTYPIILALIIGRMGCFSMGIYEETYGIPTSLFTGINLGDGLKRHPVCLYEIVFLIILWGCLMQIEKKYSVEAGGLFKMFMIFYIFFRFSLDFIKPHTSLIAGLSTIQVACVIGAAYYYRYILRPKKLLRSDA